MVDLSAWHLIAAFVTLINGWLAALRETRFLIRKRWLSSSSYVFVFLLQDCNCQAPTKKKGRSKEGKAIFVTIIPRALSFSRPRPTEGFAFCHVSAANLAIPFQF